ncbi:50S ribosomal protein L17 [Candidatus Protochlamydia amoebophila]|uniref:Large ribosomal subunit protein bL17 n=1 Tax=Candidatus Protochlamydia amoebophila TaxID=362787 RepID=A0A0C1K1V4_9BACT|nr:MULTISPECIES: 50S ribosomal protein L17 [Protochlamydia]KIC73377.1 50S ribosomal protein L17 [Candidatus Protochlamydia amoebophila]MBS4164260.1 50S ribosomal protein L17 [Candidatus Protochlamydia amoebophila]
MRHLNQTCKLNRTTSHRRCMFANMLKSLISNERIETTVPKAKALRRYADRMITLAKKNTLSARRQAIAELMIRFNSLTPKEQRAAKEGNTQAYNDDRLVIGKLFDVLGTRFATRQGGYTRIVKQGHRVGDNAQTCIIEYLTD